MSNPILRFDGPETGFLSNFATSSIVVPELGFMMLPEGLMPAATVEHAYQALKARDRPDLLWVLQAAGPGSAKKRGSRKGEDGVRINLRPDWEDVKVAVMLACLREKFPPDSAMAERLLGTGYRMLVEGNTWGDTCWGAIWLKTGTTAREPVWARRGGGLPDPGDVEEELRGQNWLGRLLMLVRAELDCRRTA